MTAIDDKVTQLHDTGFEVGTALTTVGSDDAGRLWQQFENAWLLADADGGCWIIWGATLAAYNRSGGIAVHGFPTSAQVATGRDDVTTWSFDAGSRIFEVNGSGGVSYVMSPPLLTRYDELGGVLGSLGAPAMDETSTAGTWWLQLEHGDGLYLVDGDVRHLAPLAQSGFWADGGVGGEHGLPQADSFVGDSTTPAEGSAGVLLPGGTLWVGQDGTTSYVASTPATPVTPTAGTWPRFGDGAAADAWFAANTASSTFLEWFAAQHSGQGAWSQAAAGPRAQAAYLAILSDLGVLINRIDITLPEFLTLVSVIINETGGTFAPIAERVGTAAHPGIAYAFDADGKLSYNTRPNRSAFELFNEQAFLDAHGTLPLADRVSGTTDQRWAGTVYPTGDFPTSTDPAVSGIVLQADFYKFRGRGVIQTTWRSGYQRVIGFVQGYTGSNATVIAFRDAWQGRDVGVVASQSTNADWDTLFTGTDLVIAKEAVRRHNADGGFYFTLSDDRAVLDGGDVKTDGSVRMAGKRVSGGDRYANKLHDRVFQMLTSLGL